MLTSFSSLNGCFVAGPKGGIKAGSPAWFAQCKQLQFFHCCFYIIDIINVFRFKINKNHTKLTGEFALEEYIQIIFVPSKRIENITLKLFISLVHSLKLYVSLQQGLE